MNYALKKSPLRIGIYYALLTLCSFAFLFPLYMAIINSLKGWDDAPVLLPTRFVWENYQYLFSNERIDFVRGVVNSLKICAINVLIGTFSSGLVGYAFARLRAPGRGFLFMLVLSTMMIPAIVTQIPTYILLFKFHILGTYIPFFLWAIGGQAYFIFFYRQFFAGIPKELEEAARIDGCSIFRTYWNIFLPLSLPVVATVSILNFQWTWSDSINGFMFLKADNYPIAVLLGVIRYTKESTNIVIQPVSIAAGLLTAIPVLIVFFLGQKYVVQGIVTSGVKG